MKTVVLFLKIYPNAKQSAIALKVFIKQIKLLMVTMQLTFSEGNFTHGCIG